VVHGSRGKRATSAVHVRHAARERHGASVAAARGRCRARPDRRLHGAVLTHRDTDGNLLVGGIRAAELAARYGTPLLVIDLDAVDSAIEQLASCTSNSPLDVSYAAKALATTEFFRHLAGHPIGFDVCSTGELITAERAAIAPERLTLHGAGKSDEELRAACEGRVGFIVVDGLEELQRLSAYAGNGCAAQIVLRLNLGIDARTHAFVRTGGDDTKFGIHARDEAAAVAILRDNPQLRFAGLHAHVGSQIFDVEPYLATAAALMDAATRVAAAGLVTQRVVVGGGFGVGTDPEAGASLDLRAAIGTIGEYVAARARDARLPTIRLGIEPGRAIVARAGTTLYRVLAIKRQSERTFVVVDGGIAENPRPALYGARHEIVTAAPSIGEESEITLCGRSCENDELGIVRLPRNLRSGELLAMRATGAYTYSMAGNYNRFPRPAVVGVAGGSHRLLARRESNEDVLARDDVADAAELNPAGAVGRSKDV
jgi:diaminopimelate decarboxylase